jgi:hypothetical protein
MTPTRRLLLLSASAWAVTAGVAAAQDPTGPVTRVDDVVVTAAPYGVARDATLIAVEVLDDAETGLVPLDAVLAGDLIDATRISRLLAGYRDRPPADRAAMLSALGT